MTLSPRDLLEEYDLARAYTDGLYRDLPDEHVIWRPEPDSSAIGWHLGHQGVVNHFMIRNLLAAEASLNPDLDRLFDSANPERDRGDLPPIPAIAAYRDTIADRTHSMVDNIVSGRVGAPEQLATVATGALRAIVHHEYQHDCWIGEMRSTLGHQAVPPPGSTRVTEIDGYWVLATVPEHDG